MTQVNIQEAKIHLSRLVDRAAGGEEIVIARSGKPIARLVALGHGREPRKLGLFVNEQYWIAPDFDELPDDVARAFEGDG
jgi:prevent-host-death family protein